MQTKFFRQIFQTAVESRAVKPYTLEAVVPITRAPVFHPCQCGSPTECRAGRRLVENAEAFIHFLEYVKRIERENEKYRLRELAQLGQILGKVVEAQERKNENDN